MSDTNNKPGVIGSYYVETVEKLKFIPTMMRTDRGNENGIMGSIQKCHPDAFAKKTHIAGRSTAIQRIESLWGQLRQRVTGFYISLFQSMYLEEIIDLDNPRHIDCLRYCFGLIIQQDLERFVNEWNSHHIRKQRARNISGGKPNGLYDLPEKYGGKHCQKPVNLEHLQILKDRYCEKPRLIDPDTEQFFLQMIPHQLPPTHVPQAIKLCLEILNKLDD